MQTTNKTRNIKGLLFAALLFTPFTASQAALVDVSSLTVDTLSASLTVVDLAPPVPTTVIDIAATQPLVPPAHITMGSFQSSIFDFTAVFTGGSLDATVYSAPVSSPFAPSATVDTTAGNFSDVDLSSLRISGLFTLTSPATTLSFDTELWPIVTTPTASFYDPLSGDFSLSWAVNQMVDFNNGIFMESYSTAFDVTISGSATVVPVPAALWLFISGLLGLVGLSRQKK